MLNLMIFYFGNVTSIIAMVADICCHINGRIFSFITILSAMSIIFTIPTKLRRKISKFIHKNIWRRVRHLFIVFFVFFVFLGLKDFHFSLCLCRKLRIRYVLHLFSIYTVSNVFIIIEFLLCGLFYLQFCRFQLLLVWFVLVFFPLP